MHASTNILEKRIGNNWKIYQLILNKYSIVHAHTWPLFPDRHCQILLLSIISAKAESKNFFDKDSPTMEQRLIFQ